MKAGNRLNWVLFLALLGMTALGLASRSAT